ncbi:MAG: S1 RNA-binding domain-containing protein [Anaerolineae bacterium]
MSERTITINTGDAVSGTVTRLVLSGAFVALGDGREGLLHVSQMGKVPFKNIEELIKVGDTVEAFVLKVDGDRVALTTQKPPAVSWDTIHEGDVFRGTVIRIEKYGAFVDIGAERPGMVHVSEMGDGYVQSPDEVVRVGDVIEVRVLKYNRKRRQIDLTMKENVSPAPVAADEADEDLPTAFELAMRKAQQGQPRRGASRNDANRRNRYNDYDADDIIRRTLKSHNK